MAIQIASRGRQLLGKYVKKHGDLRALAQRVGVEERVLGSYWRGARKPLTANREKLRVALKIPLLSWDEPEVLDREQGAA